MLKLSLVRHGEIEWNAQNRYQGQSDIPLSDVGRRQVELLADHLRGASFDAVYASDLKRAWETASIVPVSWTLRSSPNRVCGRWVLVFSKA
jgi:broad specificity phosphatase PhoE